MTKHELAQRNKYRYLIAQVCKQMLVDARKVPSTNKIIEQAEVERLK